MCADRYVVYQCYALEYNVQQLIDSLRISPSTIHWIGKLSDTTGIIEPN